MVIYLLGVGVRVLSPLYGKYVILMKGKFGTIVMRRVNKGMGQLYISKLSVLNANLAAHRDKVSC